MNHAEVQVRSDSGGEHCSLQCTFQNSESDEGKSNSKYTNSEWIF